MTEAADFLRALRPAGPWHLVAINPERIGPMRGCRTVTAERIEQFIANYHRRNVYFHLNVCRDGMTGVKAKKSDISHIEFIHADLDPAPGDSPADAKNRYLASLGSSGLPAPSFLVDSGGGLQMLWRIAAISVEDPASTVVARMEAINKSVMHLLGCADTSTHNIDRVLRLPGTVNHPDAKKRAAGRVPVMARLISSREGVHSLDQFPQPSVRLETTGLGGDGVGDVDPLKHDWRAVVEKYRRRLRRRHVVSLMTTDRMLSGPNKRSQMIFMIAAELRDAGADWDEIASVVWRSPYFIDKHGQSIDRLDSELSRISDYLETKGRK